MAANVSNWTNTQPSGDTSIRLSDELIRSDKSITEAVVNFEHYFDPVTSASSRSGGVHRKGSARVFGGTRASLTTPSSADSDGRLVFSTDRGSLHYLHTSSHSTIAWGDSPPGARGSSLVTTLASSNTHSVILATEDWDVGGYFVSGGTMMTVPSTLSGRYLITGSAHFPSLHTGTRRAIEIATGAGVRIAAQSAWTNSSTDAIAISVTAIENCAEGATYSLRAYQDSGGNLSLGSILFAVQRL